jgi:pimeloyl-ACP methyl ester carboxylesterase
MNFLHKPTSHYIDCAGFNLHVTTWGETHLPAVICWHGLARTGRDFDDLAEQLAHEYFVICPDTIGRGWSQWSSEPDKDYCFANYSRIALEMMNKLNIQTASWIGTSMGGAIGLVSAAAQQWPEFKGRISRLLLNDMAPELNPVAIERIKAYAGNPPIFNTLPELETFFRAAYAPFGEQTDAQWRHLAQTSARRLPDGRLTPHYDPAIMRQFFRTEPEYDLWPLYDSLKIPVTIWRGANSDLVMPPTLEIMKNRGPGAKGLLQVRVIEGCGHAPAMNNQAQWELVREFLR